MKDNANSTIETKIKLINHEKNHSQVQSSGFNITYPGYCWNLNNYFMSYTPGPWEVDGFNLTAVIKNEGSEIWPQWKHVCDCNYGYAAPEKYFEENKSNARLISAAPQLLELLEQSLPIIHDYSISGIADSDYRRSINDLEYLIKSIIKKARGL